MPKVTVELAPGVSSWAWSDGTPEHRVGESGPHEIDVTGDEDLTSALAAAVAAGALVLHEGDLPEVESQEESERLYQVAQEAMAPLYEERDRRMRNTTRLPEVVELSRDEVEEKALDGSGVHQALLRDAPHNKQRFEAPARTREDFEQLAEAGSEYHRVQLEYDDKMAAAAQEALEGES